MTWLPFAALSPALAIAILSAILTPLITYLVAVRRFSGKVNSSEAESLWEESRSIREWATERIYKLSDENTELHKEVDRLQARCHDLELELERVKGYDEPPGYLA